MVQKTLSTRRLQLQPLSEKDKNALSDLDASPEVMRYIFTGKPLSKEESTMVFEHLLSIAKTDERFGCWVGYSGNEFVGWWVLAPSETKPEGQDKEAKPTVNDKRVEVGMRVAPKFWGQGFAKEGLQAMLKYCVEDLGAEEVYGETMAVNMGSRKTMAKCGLKHVRTWHNKYEDFTPAPDSHPMDKETNTATVNSENGSGELPLPDAGAQRGVQKIEAVTAAWSKWSLAALLFNIWMIFLVNGLRLSVLTSLTPYVTSSFSSHSLLTVIYIVASALVSATYIPMAKLLDVWGRAEGFLLMVGCATLGTILMATSKNLATFCAAEVFYSIGFAGIIYTVAVLAADVTSLKNRGLAFAFTSSPYMITAFAGSKAAEGFLLHVSWQWGFGAFAIIVPCVCAPLYILLKLQFSKATSHGIIAPERSPYSLPRQFWDGLLEFDVPGVVLFAGGLTVFLLPFTLATSAPNGWKTDYIIAMIVVGFVVLVAFGLYESYLARHPFLNYKFLTDRTVIGACLFNFTYQISYYCWNSYFTSFLQVVCNLSVANAGYVNSTFQVVSGVLLFIVGYFIRLTGRFKWLFFFCLPIYMLGLGLMIHFRQPNQYIGYIVMCEIFISVGGSVFVLLVQIAVLACVDHQHVAAVLALLYVTGGIGDAVGNTVSGAIWTNTFAKELARQLPASELPQLATIYTSLTAQLAYPVGSEGRIAIQKAYGYAQQRMLAAGLGIMVLCFVWAFLMRNLNVRVNKQTKGVVF
ncbi:hypothetical protein FKW77_005168 [Venturia effusa]|uniref:Major facilitator superfamily (MFS) profile domain-containing protein n=1 Tax=Venturia effusa TaxID=50376 RepID=A0A517LFG5_9PEZI|nr:hypothetical protein FKW77_005168 [Venturia effusa]